MKTFTLLKKHFFLLLLCTIGIVNTNAYDVEVEGIYYNLNTNTQTAEVTNNGFNSYSGDIKIPESIFVEGNKYTVTSIQNESFRNCTDLISITIPNSVTSIGTDAFGYCSNLTSINIPDSVTIINNYTFRYCKKLEVITIPNSIISIGTDAFFSCSGLAIINIPNSVTSIGTNTFGYCSNLTSVTIPNSVTSIGNYAFYNCSALTSITIPNSVTYIGINPFLYCKNLSSISVDKDNTFYSSHKDCNAIIETKTNTLISGCKNTIIPNSVTSIGQSAFSGCSGLTSITIPNSVTSIETSAFSSCYNLISVTLPNFITNINTNTFSSCYRLTSINIPNSVINIGSDAFRNCENLASITIPNSVKNIEGYAFYDCSSLISINIPDAVTSIGEKAFYGCTSLPIENNIRYADTYLVEIIDKSLSSYIIKEGTRFIGNYVFGECQNLSSIKIPNTVTNIGNSAFFGCDAITSISVEKTNPTYNSNNNCNAIIETKTNTLVLGCQNTIIPNSVTTIGENAFYNCSGLTSITIPNSVTSIGGGAFGYCENLASITIPNSVTSIGNYAFSDCSSLTSINIPNSVTSIGQYAFYKCKSLTSITIPNSITSIGEGVFEGCTSLPIKNNMRYADTYLVEVVDKSLTSYTIKEGTKFIGSSAFSDCTSLTSITLPNSIINIGNEAFSDCSGLTSVNIPNSVTTIGHNAFAYCTSLPIENNMRYADTYLVEVVEKTLPSYTIKEGTKFIGSYAFDNCKNFTSITIPNSVKSFCNYAFSGCSGLTSINIPNSVTNIGEHTFSFCANLTSVNIPNSVTSIGNYTFYSCSGLTSITIPNSVTSIGDYAFSNCSSLASIIIPKSMKSVGENTFYGNYAIYCFPELYKQLYNNYHSRVKLIGGTYYNVSCINLTQTTITILFRPVKPQKLSGIKDQSVTGKSIEYNGIKKLVNGELYILEGLTPSTLYNISTKIKYSDGTTIQENILTHTNDIELTFNSLYISPTNIKFNVSYTEGYKNITKKTILLKEETTGTITTLPFKEETIDESSRFIITGLEPETTYSDLYLVVELNGGVTDTITIPSFTTPSLELTTEQPQGVSETTSKVSATTNLSNDETSVGFQWKKYDAPASLKPSEGYAAMNNGRIEGQIKRLQSTAYYNVRAFYKSAEGKYYYGDWVTFDPSDFSYIEPTIHTYPITNISQDAVCLSGYVLAGSDDIVEQGFEYWEATQSKALATIVQAEPYPTADGDVNTVLSTGQVMNTPIEGLKPMTTYGYRAFVRTATKTIYGEELSFTTPEPVGIEATETTTPQAKTLKGYYDLHGSRYDTPQKGINILRFNDGTSRTILIK